MAVAIRELSTPSDLEHLTRIFDDVWHPDPSNRPVSTDMLKALSHAGNYVAGAYVDDHLAGGSVGFFAAPVGEVLHSHMTGVSRRGHGRGLGHALKLHQRDWARTRGLSAITWTFDPLVARNAFFNMNKLGATPTAYYRDFYGDVGDELGGADESDRMLMRWPIVDDQPAPNEVPTSGTPVIDVSDAARPIPHPELITDGITVVVPVPRDIETMRRTNPAAASLWRSALREILTPLLDPGRPPRRASFDRSGAYFFGPVQS